MSYLRINPIKLNFIFSLANIKRFRRSVVGTKTTKDSPKIFYFLKLEFVITKASPKQETSN